METEGKSNRLINAKSPYLLQHAYNSVDWYEWGEEAFERASRENKPIFLSIGYSTCHWCHNMARESFEAEDVAALLNNHYISIKVDREERPDIDHIYMKVCQAMTGQGGWPLTIIMTPDKIPFFAGTYFPREKKYHLPGLKDILGGIARVWQEKRGMLEEKGRDLLNALQQVEQDSGAGDDTVVDALVDKAVEDLRQNYDHNHGGFGSAPKFPVPHALTFLLRAWKRSGDAQLLEIVVHTLKRMRQGGIFDQLGYGFHRYSVDDKWIVPHFEKMLYDQALIALAYVEAYQAAGEAVFAETAHSVFTYTLGEMQDRGGAFYAAENAESEGVEGKYYTWHRAEIMDILGKEDGSLLCDYFGITEQGNMEGGQNVLHLPHAESSFLSKQGIGEKEWSFLLESSRKKLLEARAQRIRPSRDEKILTSWNGLMISALAKGGGALRGDIYTDQARRAADFFLAKLLINGELYHQCIDGEVDIPAFLEDYAFFCAGLLDLFEVVQDPYYLEQAYQLNQKMLDLFWDKDQGGLFFAPAGNSELPLTGKDPYDGATPSGNSVAALNMLRLAAVTADDKLEQQARDLINSFARLLSASPSSFTAMLSAYDFARGPVQQIVIADAQDEETGMRMLSKVHEIFLPRRVLLQAKEKTKERLHKLCPYLDDKTAKEGKGTAYVCQNYSCQAPVNSTEELIKQLKI